MPRKKDANELAAFVVAVATGEHPNPADAARSPRATRARKAGQSGGRARARGLAAAKRREIAKKAAAARWGKE